jgi:apolipoprotein N-acyltransferase
MAKLNSYLLAMLSGALFSLAFPPMPFNILAFIFLLPLLQSIEGREKGFYLRSYLAFFVLHLGSLWWVGSWQADSDPYLMVAGAGICLLHPFFYFIPMTLYKFARSRFGLDKALMALPFIWTFYDWFKSLGDMAFPWLALGYTQANNTWYNQIADIGGVWLIGFVIVAINSLLFKLILKTDKNEGESFLYTIFKTKTKRPLLYGLSALIVLPMLYSLWKSEEYSYDKFKNSSRYMNISIIQPSINPWNKWARNVFENINDHRTVQDSLSQKGVKTDLSLWSETSITYANPEMNAKPYDLNFMQNWIDNRNFSVLSGFTEVYFFNKNEKIPNTAEAFRGDENKPYQAYNSAIIISPLKYKDTLQIYRKMKLTPFSERMPYVEYLPFAKNMLRWGVGISNWGKGWRQAPMICHTDRGDYKVASIICIESIHPDFVRKFNDAGIYTIITNDAWYDHTFGPPQHFAIAKMRAIENRRYIARCANSGISGFIAANGETIKTAAQYVNQGINERIPEIHDITLYAKFGDWIDYVSLIYCAYILVGGIIAKKKAR